MSKRITSTNNLAYLNPELALQWNTKKNGVLTPNQVFPGSAKKVWWICEKGHEWEACILSRSHGNGCPYCAGQRIEIGVNDLATARPELIKEWHPTKNGSLRPTDVTKYSAKKVWWQCPNGHEWQASVEMRVNSSSFSQCPYCTNKKVWTGYNDLAHCCPELLTEWDYEKNTDIDPNCFPKSSPKKVWWKCLKGHSWQTSPNNRSKGQGCPVCAGNVVNEGVTDLATLFPYLLSEWDYKRNILDPTKVASQTHKKAWWICKSGHSYQATISDRTHNGQGCPICKGEQRTSFPEQAMLFYVRQMFDDATSRYTANWLKGNGGKQSEIDIFIPSIATGIEYDGSAYHTDPERDRYKDILLTEHGIELIRIRESKCPDLGYTTSRIFLTERETPAVFFYETAIRKALQYIKEEHNMDFLIDVNLPRDAIKIHSQYELSIKENSLANQYPEIAFEWDSNKNDTLMPDRINAGSNLKVWWICGKGHSWKASISSRTKQHTGCPVCANRCVVVGENDLKSQCPEVMMDWDYSKNTIQPESITVGSHKRVWWHCHICGYEWDSTIWQRIHAKFGCRQCADAEARFRSMKQNLIPGVNDIESQCPDLMLEWSTKNTLKPNLMTIGSSEKVWWKCHSCGYEDSVK